jgi:hypothetical protein
MTCRREFLIGVAQAAVLAGVGAPVAKASPGTEATTVTLSRSRFTAWRDQPLVFFRDGDRTALVSVIQVVDRGSSPGIEQFSVKLQAEGANLDSGLYRVTAPDGTKFDLYVETTVVTPRGANCRADFCLLV